MKPVPNSESPRPRCSKWRVSAIMSTVGPAVPWTGVGMGSFALYHRARNVFELVC